MPQDKKLRISVEDNKLMDLKRTTTGLMNDMIRSSRQYTTSSKEVLSDLEEQIRLIEKRNRLDADQAKMGLQARFGAGQITKQQYTTGVQRLQAGTQEDKVQIQLLKEIIETIKRTSKEEIREDRVSVEKTIRRDKSLDKLGVTGDPQLALKRTLQKAILGELGESEQVEKQRFRQFGRFGRGAGGAFNTASAIGTSKNELYAMAGIVGLTPVIGRGLSTLANRFLSAGETAENSITGYGTASMAMGGYGAANRRWNQIRRGNWAYRLGLNPSEALNREADLMRAMGGSVSGLGQILGAEKFVGAGNVNQLAGISRYGQGDLPRIMRLLEGGQNNVTRLTENISAYVSASNQALNISSKVNEAGMARNIMGISAATGQQGRGLSMVTGAIQGLGATSNPIVRSLMLRSFRQANPNASLFDIQAMMEDPLANLQRGGGQFFENLRGMTGGGQMYKQTLHSVFGGQLSKTRINEILKGGGDFTQIAKEAQNAKESAFDFERRGGDVTGVSVRATARADAFFQDWGKATLQKSAEMVETLKDTFKKGTEMYEALTGLKEITKEGMDKVVESVQAIETAQKKEQEVLEATGLPKWLQNFAAGYGQNTSW